jgi:hypothetical protein
MSKQADDEHNPGENLHRDSPEINSSDDALMKWRYS